MNEDILRFLDVYQKDTDPQYAVLLDGKWGCGKTYFIRKWLEKFKDGNGEELTPLYVSLFGMKSIQQINNAINSQIFPFLNNKLYKLTKGIGKAVVGGVLKCNLDINGDGANDSTVDFKLDPLMSIFNDSEEQARGMRFLVFDDLERSGMELKELLGYINHFVEHNKFKVVLICNSEEIVDKETFIKFREKVIGRSFVIHSDTNAAIEYFVNESPTCPFLQKHKQEIKMAFQATRYSNLRVLRQCIRDFGQIYQGVNLEEDRPFHNIELRDFLVRFVVVYSELSSANQDIVANWRQKYSLALSADTQESKKLKSRIASIEQKYEGLEMQLGMYLFRDVNDMNWIPAYYYRGVDLAAYLNARLLSTERAPWDKLFKYYELSNEEFEKQYTFTVDSILNNNFGNCHDCLRAISIVVEMDDLEIRKMDNRVFKASQDYVSFLIGSLSDPNTFSEKKSNILNLLSSENPGKEHKVKRHQLISLVNAEFNKKVKELNDHYTDIIENLTDDNIIDLLECADKPLPDRSGNYESFPIFSNCNATKVANSVLHLSNAAKYRLYRFLNRRYAVETSHFICIDLVPDKKVLMEIRENLSKASSSLEYIDKFAVKSLVDLMGRIGQLDIRR